MRLEDNMITRLFQLTLVAVIPLALSACVTGYTLVPGSKAVAVAGSPLTVQPAQAWNRAPRIIGQTKWDETWTKNGPMLDSVAFFAGVPEGKAILVQRKKETRQVPPFRADMTPQDLVSMVETFYRVRGVTVFEVESVEPVPFLGGQGLKMSFQFAPNDATPKKGVCVMRVVDQKLYAMTLEGVSSHYFKAAVPEFDSLLASAALKK
jgi:hypothetical protein